MKKTPLIIDCFAGGGGASVGIEMALGRQVDIAINHDPQAIRMHKTNHPDTLHLTEDIFKVDLQKYVQDRHVALMWASPDCTSHSKAKGGKPRESGLRILPWAVYKHAKAILPDVIIMENVEEIQQWGPLDKKGYPIKERKGEEYRKFICCMKNLGYQFDSRELVAADYGAPTTRKRWYAVFRRDGKPIVFPEPTHNRDGSGGLKKWRGACEVLDFTNLGKSIFGRKKPLAENTMRRIARGLQKFVFENPDPFIVQVNHGGNNPIVAPVIEKAYGGNYTGGGSRVDGPLHTITAVDHNRLVSPYIMQIGQTGFAKDRNRSLESPLSTIVTKNEHCAVAPYIVPIGYGERKGQKPRVNSAEEPVGTLVAGSVKHYMAAPLLIQYHSETRSGEVRGQTVKEPLKTIDTSNRYGEVMAFLTKFYKSGTGQSMADPVHTITTSPGHFGQVSVLAVKIEDLLSAGVSEETAQKCTWVSEFIIEYYGSGTGQTVKDPMHTVVTKDRFALITVLGNEYVILDIFLRMLTPEELKLAQGFPRDYIINRDYDWKSYPISEQVRRIGNSVVPVMAEKLVAANCGYLKAGERMHGTNIVISGGNQLKIAQ